MTCIFEDAPAIAAKRDTTSSVRQLSHEVEQNKLRDENTENQRKGAADCSHTSCWPCHDPIFITPSWFTAPPGLSLPMGSTTLLAKELLYRGGGIDINPGPKRALPPRGRDVLVQDVLPTTAQLYDVTASEFEEYLRVRDSHGSKNSLAAVSMIWVTPVSNISESGLREAASGRGRRAHSSLAGGATCFQRVLVERIWKTPKVCFARCGACTEVSPSPSLPSAERQYLMTTC